MSGDIVIFDNLADIKALSNNEAFIHLEKRFQRERGRYLSKMLGGTTSDQETLVLKGVVNALESLSPLQLVETSLKIAVKNGKVSHPEMFKVRK